MTLTRERLEQLIAHSTDIVVATDAKGTVVYYNDGAKKTLGYADEEVLGCFVGRLYPSLAEAKRVMAAMRGPGHGGPGIVETFPTTFLSKSGEEIPVAISGTLLHDERGREDGTVGFAKDLREIRHKDKLATVGEVAVGLSHEVNNPLAVILNQAELLERDIERLSGDKDALVELERIDAVRREVARISQIVERLNEISRNEIYPTVQYLGPARMIDLRRRSNRNRTPDPRLHGVRALVVDDDLGICSSLSEILEAAGCAVTTASDGREALEQLEKAPFDVVISDVVMPNMDGYELFEAIRTRYPGLPVLMMTAFHYDKDHILKRSRERGLEAVLFKKPIDPERLREAIAEVMEARGARASSH